MDKFQVTFEKENRSDSFTGITILKAAIKLGVFIEAPCGGNKICGKCRVKITGGDYPPGEADKEYLAEHELAEGIRLACAHQITCDTTISTLSDSPALATQILTFGHRKKIPINTGISVKDLNIPEQTIENATSDFENVYNALENEELHPSRHVLQKLPFVLRESNYKLNVVCTENEILDIKPQDDACRFFGVAIDLGTTTVVCKLIDLESGEIVAVNSQVNAQRSHGEDVVARITYSMNEPHGLDHLHSIIIEQINKQIVKLSEKAKIDSSQIYRVFIAGNTVMQHILWDISPKYLAEIPFVPVFRSLQTRKASEIGLDVHSLAAVNSFPNIGGYVGGDTVAMLLTLADDIRGPWLAVDIGTNGEIVLVNNGSIYCCSTAAGPAFEGGHISCGMRAVDGAISRVRMSGSGADIQVIGDSRALGICGSGIIDAINYMLNADIIDHTGRITNSLNGKAEFKLSDKVTISQRDVREVQLAKGAIASGIHILLKKAGVERTKLKAVYLAGAFGQYINKESAVNIGLLPDIPLEKIHFIGNAASAGAELALVSKDQEKLAATLANEAQHVEISTDMEFQDVFAGSMLF